MKAALGLHKDRRPIRVEGAEKLVGCPEHHQWAIECADKSITLVKEEKGVLPLTTKSHKRILFCSIESDQGVVYSVKAGVCKKIQDLLIAEGFLVEEFVPYPGFEGNMQSYAEIVKNYDLILCVANMATKSNQTTVRIEWAQPMGSNVPIYMEQIPTVFVSVENPYHLLDVPRIKTFINTYSSNDEVLHALVDKLVGRSTFKGVSPVDAFCGKWDTHL